MCAIMYSQPPYMAGLGCCVCFSFVSNWKENCTSVLPPTTSSRAIALALLYSGGKFRERLNTVVQKNSWHPDFRHKRTKQLRAVNNHYQAVWVGSGSVILDAKLQSTRRYLQAPTSSGDIVQSLSAEGQLDRALDVLFCMDQRGTAPSLQMYKSLLKACSRRKALFEAKQVCAHVAKGGLDLTGYLGEYLVSTLVTCGGLEDALVIFDKLAYRTALSWTAVICGYTRAGQGKQALRMYQWMQQENVQPNTSIFVSLLKACIAIADLGHGKHIHAEVLRHRCQSDLFVQTCLIDMYAKCGSIEDAQAVFNGFSGRDMVSWNVMLTAYVHKGQAQEAFQLYQQMYEEGASPNVRTFMSLLQVCCLFAEKEEEVCIDGQSRKVQSLGKGKAIHAVAHRKGYDADIFLGNTLVSMYGKCGSIVDAQAVFDGLQRCDVVSWNAMLAAYAEQGQARNVLQLYGQMREKSVSPSDRTFVTLLQSCGMLAEMEDDAVVNGQHAKSNSLGKGKAIHAYAQRKGCDTDVFVGNTLINLYGKCGSIVDAQNVFHGLQSRNVVSWNAVLSAHVLHGQAETAVQLYENMLEENGSLNDQTTVVSVLQAFSMMAEKEGALSINGQFIKVKSFEHVKVVHADSQRHGYNADVFVGSTLISVYGKCGSMFDAENVFNNLSQQNVVSWTTMLLAYDQQGQGAKALQLYELMQEVGYSPNDRTFVGTLQACSMLADEEDGMTDERSMKMQALVTGKAIHAEAWRKGYHSDVFVGSTLIIMYGKCGSIKDAEIVFDGLSSHSLVAWNAMLSAYVEQSHGDSALQLYREMQEQGVSPNEITVVCTLQVCSHTGSLDVCRQIHHNFVSSGGDLSPLLANSFIHAYGRSASMVDAQAVFDAVCQPDVVSWTTLIAAYAWQGNCAKSLQCYEGMLLSGAAPNGVTFLALLSACSHAGLVDRGVEYFESMSKDYGIAPEMEHYVSMVDLLGRAGCFASVQHLLFTMPMPPSGAVWLCLLGACRKHVEVSVAEQAFECALRLQPKNAAAYVLMSNIYESAGLWDRSQAVKDVARNAGAWKKPALTWMKHEQEVHTFLAGDEKHHQTQQLCELLGVLRLQLRKV